MNGYDPLGWHVISGTHLLELLNRAEAGESPDDLFNELVASADIESFEDEAA